MSKQNKPRIVLIGLPGAGKGTIGVLLSSLLSIPQVSIGDFVRAQVNQQTELGKQIQQHWQQGGWQPLPDILTIKAAEIALASCDGWILDGFPRNITQAKEGQHLLSHCDLVLNCVVSEATSLARVESRKRSKDPKKSWVARMTKERERLPKLIQALRTISDYIEVDAEPPINEIQENLIFLLKERNLYVS